MTNVSITSRAASRSNYTACTAGRIDRILRGDARARRQDRGRGVPLGRRVERHAHGREGADADAGLGDVLPRLEGRLLDAADDEGDGLHGRPLPRWVYL